MDDDQSLETFHDLPKVRVDEKLLVDEEGLQIRNCPFLGVKMGEDTRGVGTGTCSRIV